MRTDETQRAYALPTVPRPHPGRGAVYVEVGEKKSWNAAVSGLGGSVLQSFEWGEFRRHGGWTPLRLLAEDGASAAQVLLRRLPGVGGSLAYAPHGPLASDPRDLPAVAATIAAHAKARGAHLLEIEPRAVDAPDMETEGFRRSASSVQPRCTLVLPVRESAEAQYAALPKGARYGIRRALQVGIEAETSTDEGVDLELFLDLLGETAGRQRFGLRPRDYYRLLLREVPSALVLARRGGAERPVAGALILFFEDEAYYLYGASAALEGENLYASYLVQFEALSAARRAGATRYDLWGIPCEPHAKHPLWGVYQFKRKFAGSGHEERYAGAYKKYLSPLQSHLARVGIKSYYTLQRLRGKSSGPIDD
ncbi:peptidoglycan bridge formation glycyltransferase FemA/FemB family protein [Rubrobacter marinus]|uniref:Peptidoglycan bridge formation glycyltransferase FemA/FemB family protein n=1 Tax=Rubrobacter marinus TaxID=2653852 RepID=A0A6G8PZB4_9ACTN|nr:peptidoglycan bridge formation glycyltransferase FemA/FemB family protein [Rubrobacter marinus]QIN79508.1 peptidoglycan bridge formation glycyltransferase FemA/FemB family protein [Rubrobacter marinus]